MIGRHLGTVVLVLLLALLWQALSLGIGNSSLASPLATSVAIREMLGAADFWTDVAETAQAFVLSLAIVLVGGIALGLLLGMNRLAGQVSEPLLVNLYSLPKVTLYPVVLLLFGLGMSARVAFGVMHGLIPLTLFAMKAIVQMKPVYLRTAQVMRLSAWDRAWTIVWPAIMPEIITGARLAVSLSLLGVLIGEMFASQRGLGHRVIAAMDRGDMPSVLGVALLLSGFAVLVNAWLLAIDRARQHARARF
jgi:NitT/TauT family transport system permease protein